MITTTFLLLLIAFEFWYLTSKQFKQQNLHPYLAKIPTNTKLFRLIAAVLFVISCVLFVLMLGLSSGLTAIVFAVMAAGSLIVVLQPFQYFRLSTIAILYFSILLLEFFI